MSAIQSSLLSDYFSSVRALLLASLEQQARFEQQVKHSEIVLNAAGISSDLRMRVAEAAADGRGFPF